MKVTAHFNAMRTRRDRAGIAMSWIEEAVFHPNREEIQADGRIRRWAGIPEAGGCWLRVILLEDGETLHNAFFDRRFEEK